MSTPVYSQYQPAQNRPMARLDAQGRVIPSTFDDLAYQADLNGGSTIIYEGWARPGASTSNPVWKIKKNTYSSTTLTEVQWPEDTSGHASADYQFIWANRATLTYA